MALRKSQSTNRATGKSLADLLSGTWVVVMGISCLAAMAADMGLVASRADGTELVLRVLYVVVLVGCIAGAALRFTQRLHLGRDGC